MVSAGNFQFDSVIPMAARGFHGIISARPPASQPCQIRRGASVSTKERNDISEHGKDKETFSHTEYHGCLCCSDVLVAVCDGICWALIEFH